MRVANLYRTSAGDDSLNFWIGRGLVENDWEWLDDEAVDWDDLFKYRDSKSRAFSYLVLTSL